MVLMAAAGSGVECVTGLWSDGSGERVVAASTPRVGEAVSGSDCSLVGVADLVVQPVTGSEQVAVFGETLGLVRACLRRSASITRVLRITDILCRAAA
jgi:hypothetical protein